MQPNATSAAIFAAAADHASRHAHRDAEVARSHPELTSEGEAQERDSALIEAGFRLGLGEGTNVSLTYQGDIGATSRDHGFNARFSARF